MDLTEQDIQINGSQVFIAILPADLIAQQQSIIDNALLNIKKFQDTITQRNLDNATDTQSIAAWQLVADTAQAVITKANTAILP